MAVTLADHLRALPDDGLAALVALRPDLVVPVPADISALAARAQSRLSVARALDGLDRFTLEILDALRLTRTDDGTTTVDSVLALTAASGVDASLIRQAIERLRRLCLSYGSEHALHLVASLDEVSSPHPAGLGRPAAELDTQATALVDDPARLRRTLLAAPPAARAVLERLATGPPLGTITGASLLSGATADAVLHDAVLHDAVLHDATAGGAEGESPVRWLVAHHLLVAIAEDVVELPREVALLLRRDSGPLGALHPRPPELDGARREPAAVDQAGAGQGMEAVRHTEALLEALSTEPAPVLRAGGLGVRELRRLARSAAVTEGTAALLLEVAYAGGLLGDTSGGGVGNDPAYLPAAGYDNWRALSIAARWHRLARAWLRMTRAPSLVGQRADRDRLIPALSPDVDRVGAPSQRRAVLDALADAPLGSAPTMEDIRAVLDWRTPRRTGRTATTVSACDAVLAEATALGLTGLGALTGFGRLLLGEVLPEAHDPDADPLGLHADAAAPPGAEATLDALLPAPVDHVLLQADLTVVVPGPPEPALAAELDLVAAAESSSVYRITAESVRRALDTGFTAADLHALFSRRSRTPVPQGLGYLVDDVARRHGGLRAGSAGGYLRSDDEALIAEVLSDRRLAALALRRLAPTVLVSPYPVPRLLGALREWGYSPVPEDANGSVVLSRPKLRRAAARSPVPSRRSDDPLAQPRLGAPRLAGIIEQIRHGEAVARAARRAPVLVRSANGSAGTAGAHAYMQAMAVLQQAVRDRARVWVGYVDSHGGTASRLLRPVSIGGGYLRAEDERTETLHTFALHRITAAVPEGS